jgi:hypothetical protein
MIDYFTILEDGSAQNFCPPMLLPLFWNKVGTDTPEEFKNPSLLLQKHSVLKQQRQALFLSRLASNKLLEPNMYEGNMLQKPDFICLDGQLWKMLLTPALVGEEWEINAAKIGGYIYLWSKKYESLQTVTEFFLGNYLRQVLTKNTPEQGSMLKQLETSYSVTSVTFGCHQILQLTEIDAMLETKKAIDIMAYSECGEDEMRDKLMKYWAKAIISGVQNAVLGKVGYSSQFTKLEQKTIDDIGRESRVPVASCMEFQDRILKWIKGHLIESNSQVNTEFCN